MPNKKRIFKSEKFVSIFIDLGGTFHVGILWEDYINSPAIKEYGLPRTFTEGREVLPSAQGGTTKANQNGRLVRKQPEEKEVRTVPISFINRNGTHVSYLRDFNVYVKELVSQYDMKFVFRTNQHGQQVVVSPPLTYTNTYDSNLKNTHAINLFLEVFADYEVFDQELNPAIPFNKRYKEDFLKKGTITKNDTDVIQEIIKAADDFRI
jgi:hypothetical protein